MAPAGELRPSRSLTTSERRAFRAIVEDLASLNLTSSADGITVTVLARAVVRSEAAAALLQREGLVSRGARGGPIRHPAALVLAEADATCLRAASELGLSPVSRERLRRPETEAPLTYRRTDDGV